MIFIEAGGGIASIRLYFIVKLASKTDLTTKFIFMEVRHYG